MAPMPDELAFIRMPPATVAPAYADSLSTRSHLRVDDLGAGLVAVSPAAGAGAVEGHFELFEIADASTDLEDDATWEPFQAHPPRADVGGDARHEYLLRRATEIARDQRAEAQFTAMALQALAASSAGDLEDLLKVQLPPLFAHFPDGRLFYVTISDVLLARFAFARSQLALQLTPDIFTGEEMYRLRALEELTLTQGTDSTGVTSVPLLALSPGVSGIVFPALPHSLVFCFGTALALQRPYPHSFSALFRPRVLDDPEGLNRSALTQDERTDDGPEMLRWWLERLNVLYSHISDPTRWTDQDGYFDASAQSAWMVTLERMLGDTITLLAEPQATELDRVQMAFDLLDKAESLLGYGEGESGRGFRQLVRRGSCLKVMREAFGRMPALVGPRLLAETERLFDGLYEQVRANTLSNRLTDRGARIAKAEPDQLHSIDNDTLVADVLRAVRNSSHGLLETLRRRRERFLLAANTGGVPAEFSALAPLLALGLLAEAEAVIDGSLRTRLTGH